jgi:hypothetical protein
MEDIRKHDRIQTQIISVCQHLGIEAKHEYRGKGWRADVFIPSDIRPIAFEIQLSPQSLSKTLQRQSKYIRDEIIGCWLFENPIPKLIDERPDLPVFYVEENDNLDLIVNLGTRRKIDLHTFLESFISNNIQFRPIAKTNSIQTVKLVFYEMTCWKCKELNHIFYVATPFHSSCNAEIQPEEALWESNSIEYRPEIIKLATDFTENSPDLNLKLGHIKERFSHTVGKSYMSFGCYKCDSIFGDFYVMDAKMDVMYDTDSISHIGQIELKQTFELDIPHWCFPEDGHFCGDH